MSRSRNINLTKSVLTVMFASIYHRESPRDVTIKVSRDARVGLPVLGQFLGARLAYSWIRSKLS